MRGLLKVIEPLVISRIISSGLPVVGTNKAGLSFIVLSGLLLVLSLGFFLYAAHLYFVYVFPPEIAIALTGSVTLLCSILSALCAYIIFSYKKRRAKQMKHEMIQKMEDLFKAANDEFGEPIQDNPKTALLISSLAGFVAGEKLF